MDEPLVQVGILSEEKILFILHAPHEIAHGKRDSNQISSPKVCGLQTATYHAGRICWDKHLYDELVFSPMDSTVDSFELVGVTIGLHFHWERKENQHFQGALKIIVEGEKLTAINIIGVEDYLTSVISSEMSASASPELLKAHTVISRSWLLDKLNPPLPTKVIAPMETTSSIKWYDHEAHTRFDVCADDHCQRYQGITRAWTSQVKQAVKATQGQVLKFEGRICDARFSKCCGGVLEEFRYCWDDVEHPYLTKQRDSKSATTLPDLRIETEAERWIRTSPEAFCHTTDKRILAQVLNNYDQETIDFYRWQVSYTVEELSELVRKRSGVDYGEIIDLIPVERGVSGRLSKLKIVGTKRTMVIGKELEIRRTLSESHLYSSAFVVDKVVGGFMLTGAGWGHGVGLCQIGAAMMGEQGFAYHEILLHYYIGAEINKLY